MSPKNAKRIKLDDDVTDFKVNISVFVKSVHLCLLTKTV